MKDETVYLKYIIECIDEIGTHLSVGGKNSFFENITVREATLRSLQKMAETTQRLSNETKSQMSEIEWADIAGLRNILVHDYLGNIDFDIVWRIIEIKVPQLKTSIQDYLANKEK